MASDSLRQTIKQFHGPYPWLLFHRGRLLEQFSPLGVRHFPPTAAPVLPDDHRIEVREACYYNPEPGTFAKLGECLHREIVQVLRVNIAILCTEQSHRQRMQVGDEHKAKPAGSKHRVGVFQKSLRLGQVFDDGPEGDRVEGSSGGIPLTRPSATLSPSEGERDGERGCLERVLIDVPKSCSKKFPRSTGTPRDSA